MERILIVTIRAKGGGAEAIIDNLTKSKPDIFKWVNMESFLKAPFIYRYIKLVWGICKEINKVDKVIIGTEGLLGLIIFPFRIYYKKKFILWNHCYFPDYQHFLSFKNRILYRISYAMYPLRINASPASQMGIFIPNPYFFNENVDDNNGVSRSQSWVILSVSSLAKLKSVDLTIKLLTKLPNDIKLNIFGDGAERNSLEKLVDDIGVRERVKFWGFKKEPFDVNFCFSRLLIVNSKTEALPTIILEAIEHHIPVIVRSYNGAEYWQNLKTVFTVEEITPDIPLRVMDYFNSLCSDDYFSLFNHDLKILRRRHDYSCFINHINSL
ncbi:glycosyltransferase [Aeromonas hydrophila]|uniref:glycosyltransferase n=1 Tax=Aeromonas hydrophila TaxID=644 RepID=UPI001C7747D1|nr:glycosyltransferase [Aeromonas hydrophila]QWL70485.1 glycosyltransferase [Aeromonas hydrophila]